MARRSVLSRFATRLMQTVGLATLGAAATMSAMAPLTTAEALVVRGDSTPNAARDTNNTFPWVGQMVAWNNRSSLSFGTCSGQVIAPRVVLFAAHCFGGVASGAGELYGTGAGLRDMAFIFNASNLGALRQWVGLDPSTAAIGASHEANRVYRVIDLIGHPLNAANEFTAGNADIALAVLDQPVAGFNGYGMLFSPLTAVERVELAGYGRTGTMETGQSIGVDWWRRVGENTMSFLGSDNDVFASDLFGNGSPFPGYNGDLYWMDSDSHIDPRPAGDFNIFGGAALPNEVGIAQGDSGGAMWVRRNGVPLAVGVASYGYFFGSGAPSARFGRGTITAHTPLFPYWDFIVANNAYVYTAAVTGGGAWESGATWVQMLDPNYLIVNGQGQLVNALPTTPPVSDTGAAPNVGGVRPLPLFPVPNSSSQGLIGDFTGWAGATGGLEVTLDGDFTDSAPPKDWLAGEVSPDGTLRVQRAIAASAAGGIDDDRLRMNGLGNAQLIGLDGEPGGAPTSLGVIEPGGPIAASSGYFPVGTAPLTGPGSTNFVPNNTNGAPGAPFVNAARFFEVQLVNSGTVTLSSTRTIDRLRIMSGPAGLTINANGALTTVMGSSLEAGNLIVNGSLRARGVTVTGGVLSGTGTIQASGGVGVSGAIQSAGITSITGGTLSPGGAGSVGVLTFQGNVGMGSAAQTQIDIASAASNDRIVVANLAGATSGTNGGLAVSGALGLNFLGSYRPTFGTNWTVATSVGGASGAFTSISSSAPLGLLFPVASTDANSVTVRMDALAFQSFVSPNSEAQQSIGGVLDVLRSSYAANSALFDSLDQLTPAQARVVLEQIAPNDNLAGRQLITASVDNLSDVLLQRSLRAGGSAAMAGDFSSGAALALRSAAGGRAATADQMLANPGPIQRALGDGVSVFADVRQIEGSTTPSASYVNADLEGTVTTFGMDMLLRPGLHVGVAGQLSDADSTLAGSVGSASGDGGQGAVFASYASPSGALFDAYFAVGSVDLELRRSVGASVLRAAPSADTQAYGFAVSTVLQGARLGFVPRVAMDRVEVDIGGYTETGGPTALVMPGQEATQATITAGATVFATFGHPDGVRVFPRATINGVWDTSDEADQVSGAAFASAPGTQFRPFNGGAPDSMWWDATLGLDVQIGDRFTVGASYSTDLGRDDVDTDTVRVAARMAF